MEVLPLFYTKAGGGRGGRWADGQRAAAACAPHLAGLAASLSLTLLHSCCPTLQIYKKHVKMLFPRVSGAWGWAGLAAPQRRRWQSTAAELARPACCAAPSGPPQPACCLYPSLGPAEHDPLTVTAGLPYEGRPEIHRGDNLSAMGPTPSLMSLPPAATPAGARARATGGNGGADMRPAEMV